MVSARDPALERRLHYEFSFCLSYTTTKMEKTTSQSVFFFFFESGMDQIRSEAGGLCSPSGSRFLGVFGLRREDIFLVSANKTGVYLSTLLNRIAFMCLVCLSRLIWNGTNRGGCVGRIGGYVGIALEAGRSARG